MHFNALGLRFFVAGNRQPVPQRMVIVAGNIGDRLCRVGGPGPFGIRHGIVIDLRVLGGGNDTEFNVFLAARLIADKSPLIVYEHTAFDTVSDVIAKGSDTRHLRRMRL